MNESDYWEECIAQAAEECDLILTKEQLQVIAEAAQGGHEHYGTAFYSPPNSERLSDIEDEYKKKIKDKEKELEDYRDKAEDAMGRALRLRPGYRAVLNRDGGIEVVP